QARVLEPVAALVHSMIWREAYRGEQKAFRLSIQARFQQDRRAERRGKGRAVETAALRHPEARSAGTSLRSSARARWRVQVLGRDPRPLARSSRQASGSGGGGSPAGIWR